jgi:alpha-galactosidase
MTTTRFLFRIALAALAIASVACVASVASSQDIWLDKADLSTMACGWNAPNAGKSIDGNPLTIGGKVFERGIGTHALSTWLLETGGKGQRFLATVGVDDEVKGPDASVEFFVLGDRKVLWTSGVLKAGDEAKQADVDIAGVRMLGLLVTDAGDGIDYDHADWADARIVAGPGLTTAALTAAQSAEMKAAGTGELPILTPPAKPAPRINGASVFGVRPGHPVLYTVAATGDRPMTFSAANLPKGLAIDAATGRISGTLSAPGVHPVTVTATNAAGAATKVVKIISGEEIALTPPLGWNSWNCWGGSVTAEQVLSSARAMAEKGLANHGWTYINIDDGWQGVRGGDFNGIQGNRKFRDMKGLADAVHALGLKIGIYSTPWKGSYEGHIGSSADNEDGTYDFITKGEANEDMRHGDYEKGRNMGWEFGKHSFAVNDAKQWAAWGFDYLKYDWNPNDVPHVDEMAGALRESGRDIVLSLSNSAPFASAAPLSSMAQVWRTTGDIRDTWESVSRIGFSQDRWRPYARPGHWNDPDMLVVGLVGWGPKLHQTRLTPDEQYTHISLWSLLAAPLLLGNDLARLDDFTIGLLTNDEVLEVNQDPLGKQGALLRKTEGREIWVKDLEDGSKAVAIFYPANEHSDPAGYFQWEGTGPVEISFSGAEIGFPFKFRVRDLWRQQDLGSFSGNYTAKVPYHGVVLLRVWNAQ